MYRFMLAFLMMFLFVTMGYANHPEPQGKAQSKVTASPKFRGQLFGALKAYLQLKDALVASDNKLAAKKAAAFKTAFSGIDAALLKGKSSKIWKKNADEVQDKLKAQVAATDLEKQRVAFLPLSNALTAAAKAFGPFNSALYLQYCPMAFNDTGAGWLSDSDKVLNPYFGDKMLRCGSVKESIAAK